MNKETSFLEQYERNLLKACQDLHMDITGASDTLSLMQRIELVGFLKQKIFNWRSLICHSKAYDDAVKRLIEITISESTGTLVK
jgi:hypothetical protein